MQLAMDDGQRAVVDTASEVLGKLVSFEELVATEGSATGCDERLWSTMVELGWTSLGVPEEHGGLGAPLADVGLLVQEVAKVGAATPLLSHVQATALLGSGGVGPTAGGALKRLAGGAVMACIGMADEVPRARGGQGGWRLSAERLPVTWAHLAEELVVVARDDAGTAQVFLFDAETVGVEITSALALDNERLGLVTFDDVDPGEPVLSLATQIELDEWLAPFRALQAASLVACARRMLEMTVEYMEIRKQFGRALGSLPTVHQVLADVAIEVDGASLATSDALARIDEGLQAGSAAAVAAYFAGTTAQNTALRVAQLHGALGFMKEYPLQVFFRRAKAGQLRLGTPRSQQDMLARLLLPTLRDRDPQIAIEGIQPRGERRVDVH